MNLVLVQKRLYTLDGTDTVLFTWTDSNIANSVNFIGEKKRIQFTFDSKDDMGSGLDVNGMKLYINFALFIGNGYINDIVEKGTRYWSYKLPAVIVPGTTYDCTLVALPADITNACKNYKVTVKTVTAQRLLITLDFYQTYDENNYLEPIYDQNQFRFTKDGLLSDAEFVTADTTIYNDTNRDGRIYIWSDKAGDTGSVEELFGGYTARFYNDGSFTDSDYKFYDDAGNEIQSINKVGFTTVKCFVKLPSSVGHIVTPYFAIIRTDTSNNSIDFITNYEYEQQLCDPSNTSDGVIIRRPYTQAFETWDDSYIFTFRLYGPALDPTGTYRIIGSLYGINPASTYMPIGANVSKQASINSAVPYTGLGLDFSGVLSDYEHSFLGNNLECVVEERIQSSLFVQYFFDKFKNDIYNRLGIVLSSNDIRTYLTQIEFSIYEEYTDTFLGVVRNIMDKRVITRASLTSYIAPADTSATFVTDQANFIANWRNRYESAVPCQQTLVGGVNYLPLQGDQDWAGKTLFVEWNLVFFYHDYSSPFTDNIKHIQKIRVNGYNAELVISAQSPADEGKAYYCPGETMCLKAAIDPTLLEYKLINTIEADPGNIITIKEAEAWVGTNLSQLQPTIITNQETDYGQTTASQAKFCIDTLQLNINTTYKVSAMAKKVAAAPTDSKITEGSDQKITEGSDNKIVD